MIASAANFGEEYLRARITLVWSYFLQGDFKTFASMWSERNQSIFNESAEEWKKNVRIWSLLHRESPRFELLDLEISSQRARARMRVSRLEKDGSWSSDILYDHWVFEGGDWFLDDAGRTE